MAGWFRRSHIRDQKNSSCQYHREKELIFICKDCNNVPICVTCVSTIHSKHAVNEIARCTPSIKEAIKTNVKNTENEVIPRLEEEMMSVDSEMSNTENEFKYITNTICTITDRMVQSCYGLKSENLRVLENHRADTDSKIQSLHAEVQKRKGLLHSGTPLQVYEISTHNLDNTDNYCQSRLPGVDMKPEFLIEKLKDLMEQLSKMARQQQEVKPPQDGATNAVMKKRSGNENTTSKSYSSMDLKDIGYRRDKRTDPTLNELDIGNDQHSVTKRNIPGNEDTTSKIYSSMDLKDIRYRTDGRIYPTLNEQDIGNDQNTVMEWKEPGNENTTSKSYSSMDLKDIRYKRDMRTDPTLNEQDIGNNQTSVPERKTTGNESHTYKRFSICDVKDSRYQRYWRTMFNIQNIGNDEGLFLQRYKPGKETIGRKCSRVLDLSDVGYRTHRTERTFLEKEIGQDIGYDENLVMERSKPVCGKETTTDSSYNIHDLKGCRYQRDKWTDHTFIEHGMGDYTSSFVERNNTGNETATSRRLNFCEERASRYQRDRRTDPTFKEQDIGNDKTYVTERKTPGNKTTTYKRFSICDVKDSRYQRDRRTMFNKQDIANDEGLFLQRYKPGKETIGRKCSSVLDLSDVGYRTHRTERTFLEQDVGQDIGYDENLVMERNKPVCGKETTTDSSYNIHDLRGCRYQRDKWTDHTFIEHGMADYTSSLVERNNTGNETATSRRLNFCDETVSRYQRDRRTDPTFKEQDIGNDKTYVRERNKPGNKTNTYKRFSICDVKDSRYQRDTRTDPMFNKQDIGNDGGNVTIRSERCSVLDLRNDRYRTHRTECSFLEQNIGNDKSFVMEWNKPGNEFTTRKSTSICDERDSRYVGEKRTDPTYTGNDKYFTVKRNEPERAIVRFSYIVDNPDKLSIKENEVVTILEKNTGDSGSWKGELNGKIGLFPKNFVELLPRESSI